MKTKKKWSNDSLSAVHLVLRRVNQLLNPPPCLKIWEWAELRRRLGRNVTAKPGRYQVSTTPYQQEPQESFTDHTVQTTVLYWGKRLGKTEMINNLHGATIEQNPRNILVVYPTLDSAKKWSKQFFSPMVRSTPVLRDKIRERSRDASQTILAKEFPGGIISCIGTNSSSAFRQVQAPVVSCDEVDAFEDGLEGDPITLAFGRAENYPDSIQIVSSTATEITNKLPEGETMQAGFTSGSKIHDWWLKSDQRKWFVLNPCCGKRHVLAWANVKWPEPHRHEDAYYECPDCHEHWDDLMRVQAIMDGQWQATAPFRGIRGYWLNGLNTTFSAKKGYQSKMHQFASEFYDAYTSGEAARKAWQNTFLCEPKFIEPEKVDANPLYERQEDYAPQSLPEDICIIGLVLDVQGDRLEYEFIGLGENDETWGIEYGKVMGDPEKDFVWKDAIDKSQRTFKRRDGIELKVDFIACDHRHKGSRVRAFLRRCGHPRTYAMYGASGPDKQSLLVIPHKSKQYKMNLYSVGTDSAKDILFARIKLKEPGPRYMHWPTGNGYEKRKEGYFDQLTAEELKTEIKKGRIEKHYELKPGVKRNEALDIRVYFLAAVDILRPAVSVIKRELLRKLDANRPAITSAMPPRRPVETLISSESENIPEPKPSQPRKRFSMRAKM